MEKFHTFVFFSLHNGKMYENAWQNIGKQHKNVARKKMFHTFAQKQGEAKRKYRTISYFCFFNNSLITFLWDPYHIGSLHTSSECLNIQMSEYPNVKISQYPNVQIYECPNIWTSKYPNIRMSKCPEVQKSECPNLKMSTCKIQLPNNPNCRIFPVWRAKILVYE